MTQSETLLALIAKGLHDHAKQSTAAQLGDRSQYIGMSDIGLMQECPRLAVLRKVAPISDDFVSMENYERILKRQLTLQRGHWLEEGIANALYSNGFHVIPQLEICIPTGKTTIKAHLDFTLVGENTVRILELKSNESIPKKPKLAYETQLQGQSSLLQVYWNEPVFTLRDAHGTVLYENKTFPEISQVYLGITVPRESTNVDIQGWLLCISMNSGQAFGPYIPSQNCLNLCHESAQNEWQFMQDYIDDQSCTIPHARGFCLLCSFCEYVKSCPKFGLTSLDDWESTLAELENLKAIKEQNTQEIAQLENEMKQSILPTDLKGRWITAGRYRLRIAEQQGRKTLQKDLLMAELTPLMGEDEAKRLLAQCESVGVPFARIYTNTINS